MLSKCANPACSATFLYLREGKLFQLETPQPASGNLTSAQKTPESGRQSDSAGQRRVEYFWLCNSCSSELTLHYRDGEGVMVVPIPRAAKVAAAA